MQTGVTPTSPRPMIFPCVASLLPCKHPYPDCFAVSQPRGLVPLSHPCLYLFPRDRTQVNLSHRRQQEFSASATARDVWGFVLPVNRWRRSRWVGEQLGDIEPEVKSSASAAPLTVKANPLLYISRFGHTPSICSNYYVLGRLGRNSHLYRALRQETSVSPCSALQSARGTSPSYICLCARKSFDAELRRTRASTVSAHCLWPRLHALSCVLCHFHFRDSIFTVHTPIPHRSNVYPSHVPVHLLLHFHTPAFALLLLQPVLRSSAFPPSATGWPQRDGVCSLFCWALHAARAG